MPVGKSRNLNKEKGEAGERLTQKMFGLAPTSGSGCGRFDKQDSKNDFLRVETKTTGKDHYVLKLSDWKRWRQQAAKARSQFFLHLIHENTDGSLDEVNSRVVISYKYWEALKPETWIDEDAKLYKGLELCNVAWGQEWLKEGAKSVKIEIPEESTFLSGGIVWQDACCYTGENIDLVSLPAPYFKELLEKDEAS